MATRRERVILSLTDDYTPGILRAAAATRLLDKAIDGLDGNYVGAGRGTRSFNKELDGNTESLSRNRSELTSVIRALEDDLSPALDSGSRALRRQKAELDSYSGRLRLIAKAVAVFGPGLVPFGGVAIAGVAGLAAQLGAATTAGIGAVIAFQGVGGALDALNKASLEPTEANLEKARQALDQIGPSAQALVGHLFELRDEWRELKDAAADGLFPGVDEALTHLETRMPDFTRALHDINAETGRLAAEGAENIAGPGWDQFFEFIRTDGVDTLRDLGHSIGNVTKGVTELVMAFDPLNDDFSHWMVDATANFADWADGLDQTEGFQDFINYVRETGPQVADTLGAVSMALIDIVQAAAPLGGPVLAAIEAVAKAISTIADSEIGTPLLTALSAISLLSTGLRASSRVMDATFGLRGAKTVRETTAAYKAALPTLAETGTFFNRLGQSSDRASKSTLAARESMRGFARTVAPAAAGAAAIGFVATGLSDKMGLTNTATLALAGSLAGPWGAAVGAGIGLVADFAASNDGLEDSMRQVNAAASAGDLTDWASSIGGMQDELDDMQGFTFGLKNFFNLGQGFRDFVSGTEDIKEQKEAFEEYRLAVIKFQNEVVSNKPGERIQDTGTSDAAIDDFVSQIGPKMKAAGFDPAEVFAAGEGSALFQEAIRGTEAYLASLDSVPGRAAAVQTALAAMATVEQDTATQAAALGAALDALFSPFLDKAAAADAVIAGLKDLKTAMSDLDGASIFGKGDKQLAARGAAQASVADALNKFKADANALPAGADAGKLVENLNKARKAIIDTAVAAGANKKEIESYLNTLGMTPANLTTFITTPGVLDAKQQIQALSALYNLTPKQVQTLIAQLGMAKSQSDIKALAQQYHMTPKEVRTLIKAEASGAFSAIAAVKAGLATIPRDISVRVNVIRTGGPTGSGTLPDRAVADGGIFEYADGGMHAPSIGSQQPRIEPNKGPRGIMWAETGAGPWEAFISGHPAKRERSRGIADEVVGRLDGDITWYADGGIDERRRRGDKHRPDRDGNRNGLSVKGLIHEFGSLKKAVEASRKAVDREKSQRDKLVSARTELSSSVKDKFNSDLFTPPDNPFAAGAGDFMSILRNDVADLNAEKVAIGQLKRKGLDGGALAALLQQGDLSAVQGVAQLPKAQLAQLEKVFEQRAALQTQVGNAAGQAAYGADQKQQTRELKQANRRLHRLEQLAKAANKHHKDGPKKTGDAVKRGVNGAASRGRRDSR